ncbi:DUF4381 domain-containing protein [Kangiella aquimarina]|uniref:DUF4381 domain-containing protein n=1 Tax=Kangiella aquimarina TaxID=261965 RepID=A0ABZ0X6U5_9GAMM|nr:DUF4381 domain-containing protein [Kangiella aquimarina]WQG86239.1 DUF4381 domain-containing protein [Kangiella aquimarina]
MANPQQAQLLEQLRDIHLPEGVSWWPLAIGWWIVIAIIITVIVLLIAKAIVSKRRQRFARYALIELDQVKRNADKDWLMQTHHIMRRASLCYFPKSQVAVMDNKHWVILLYQTGSNIWSQQSLQLLEEGIYRNPDSIDSSHQQQFLNEAALWLEQLPNIKQLPAFTESPSNTGQEGAANV